MFIVVIFSIISSYTFSQTDLSNNPIKTGIVTDITPEKIVISNDDDGGIIIPQPRLGAFANLEIGDRVSYIIINYPNNFILIKEIKLIGD